MNGRRKRLSDADVAGLPVKADRYTLPDPELRGHYIRVSTGGTKSFWAAARDPRGKQHWRNVGAPPMPLTEARAKALTILHSIRQAPPDSFEGVAEEWFRRHVLKNKRRRGAPLRSAPQLGRFLRLHIIPAFAGMDFASVRRKDISRLLDKLEDEHGARQADYGLSIVRQICNWHAARDDNYSSPVVKGMERHGVQKRDRILSDDELRAVWTTASANGAFGSFVRLLLITAQRRDKVASMKWADLDLAEGVWTIAAEDGEKGNGGDLALPRLGLDIIAEIQPIAGNPHVFAGRNGSYSTGYSKSKKAFDAKLAGTCKSLVTAGWTLHDLRRTARSLMAAAGVRPDIAERVMGHAIAGVEGVYDRHAYRDEKADALLRLATRIKSIVMPPPNNLEQLRRAS